MARSFIFSRAFADIFSTYGKTAVRYPISIAGSVLLTIGLIALDVEASTLDPLNSNEAFWTGVIFTGVALLPLGVLARLASEAWGLSWLMPLFAVAVGATIGWLFYLNPLDDEQVAWQTIPALFICYWMAAVFPSYLIPGGNTSFIPWSRALIFRGAVSFVFSLALFGAMALLIVSIDVLFNASVDGSIYAYLFFFSIGMIFPGQWLTGLPWDAAERMSEVTDRIVHNDLPGLTHFLARYLLIPFTAGYILVLYAYFFRQIILGEWPQGWIGPLSIGLGSLAIFTRYFASVIPSEKWNVFEKSVMKAIFPALLPVGLAIILAIYERVEAYGWTEGRWTGMLIGIWITGMSVYYTIRPGKDLRHGLWGLVVLLMINWIGPFSAVRQARANQLDRLIEWEAVHIEGADPVRPWENWSREQMNTAREQLDFFVYRDQWTLLESQSRLWPLYRSFRGNEEPEMETWNALRQHFTLSEDRSRIMMDWALEGEHWIGQVDPQSKNEKHTFKEITRGRNQIGPWEIQWRYPPRVRTSIDGVRSDWQDLPGFRQAMSELPLYYRYSSVDMPCFMIHSDDLWLKMCLARMEGKCSETDTVLYNSAAWLSTNARIGPDN